MSERFQDKVVVITGAAGGIGRETALRFASEGAHVVAVDIDPSQLDETMKAVRDAGGDGLPLAGSTISSTTPGSRARSRR